MSVRRDLQNAATLLREFGWCQGRRFDDEGRCCAFGAIISVAVGDYGGLSASAVFKRYVKADTIGGWNDAPGRTADEVIAALEAAAESAPDV